MTITAEPSIADRIAPELPYLRRYARALTGNQSSGDSFAAATLEAIIAEPRSFDPNNYGPRVALYEAFQKVWLSAGAPVTEEATHLEAKALDRIAPLTPDTRQALLLHTVEGFSVADVAKVMTTDTDHVESLISRGREDVRNSVAGKVMIIEDEAIIAMDLQAIVSDMGHSVTGVARTHGEAVELAKSDPPDMILADIQLADNSSGIEAVHEIMTQFGELPVIFITAFPERLLTGTRPEPTFLISKPYTDEQISSSVSQAMFFSSVETLSA